MPQLLCMSGGKIGAITYIIAVKKWDSFMPCEAVSLQPNG